ncbi:cAMP-regulated phosphoprotein 19 [Echinococcus granulosus]|uniref:cAMP regulated phosphoprotein 19 n=1 Tax=Echinococcus granulosus TaxID=6210 RepID=A0A068WDQ2_ECHGR|nr:cAMP-regulated phosphoprotein 19 [Echinococcus granulosus]CDS15755.1 cAMP regulated phosphoprotein 19 [Echinococcus granulosus]
MSASDVKASVTSQEEQESELKAKYPGLAQRGAASMLLQKRLNRGHKFFDSGDYNMARAKTAQQKSTTEEEAIEKEEILQESTGVTIATPESVPAVRRKSMVGGLRSHRDSLTATEPHHHPGNQ